MTEQQQITSEQQRNGLDANGYGLVHASNDEEIWSDGETGVKITPGLADVEFFSELEGEPVKLSKMFAITSILGISPPGMVMVPEERLKELECKDKGAQEYFAVKRELRRLEEAETHG